VTEPHVDEVMRAAAPRVLANLIRHYGDFGRCEDALQEALLDAHLQWPATGIPASPSGWLTRVAQRRWIESVRQDSARRKRELRVTSLEPDSAAEPVHDDDTLNLLVLCCHPALSEPSQVALTLRAVGGLTTSEIARAYLVPDATIGQRISRAKRNIEAAGATFKASPQDRAERRDAVLAVLYLIFNEGYTASSGEFLQRVDLTTEATRLTRQLHQRDPSGEATGLLALMLLTDARRPARTGADGALIRLAEQDRQLWDRDQIAEGTALVESSLARDRLGPFQLQAAIAAIHDEAPSAGETDWAQILVLYRLLEHLSPGPMVTLGRVVAEAMVNGPSAALSELDRTLPDSLFADHHRTHAVRAHLLDMRGDFAEARSEYEIAARRTLSGPEQRYLYARARALRGARPASPAG
jgi:predicted RNA polymerase sigma factor